MDWKAVGSCRASELFWSILLIALTLHGNEDYLMIGLVLMFFTSIVGKRPLKWFAEKIGFTKSC
jgi:hypothetical protein